MIGCRSYRDIEDDGGWAGVKLGSSPDELGGKLLRDDGAGDKLYERADEPKTYGKAPVGGIRYEYYDDELWRIEVRTGHSKHFLDELTRHYGTPPFNRPWQWEGETVRMNFIGHEYDASALLVLVHKPLEARRERERPARLEAIQDQRKAEVAAREQERKAKEQAERAARAAQGDTDTDAPADEGADEAP